MARFKCKLCSIKRIIWESDNFYGIKCKNHFVPMIVLKDHRFEITDIEKIEVLEICKLKYPNLYLDNTISDSDIHWHIHLSKKNKHVSL